LFDVFLTWVFLRFIGAVSRRFSQAVWYAPKRPSRHGAGAKYIEVWRAAILQPCAPKLEHFRAVDMERQSWQATVIFFVVIESELMDVRDWRQWLGA
jgi:hypothetical protein